MSPAAYGRSTRNWKRMVANLKAQRLPCCICWQPIDYSLPVNDRGAFTTAHLLPVALYPHLAEDPGNVKGAAHRACNAAEGTSIAAPGEDTSPTSTTW